MQSGNTCIYSTYTDDFGKHKKSKILEKKKRASFVFIAITEIFVTNVFTVSESTLR